MALRLRRLAASPRRPLRPGEEELVAGGGGPQRSSRGGPALPRPEGQEGRGEEAAGGRGRRVAAAVVILFVGTAACPRRGSGLCGVLAPGGQAGLRGGRRTGSIAAERLRRRKGRKWRGKRSGRSSGGGSGQRRRRRRRSRSLLPPRRRRERRQGVVGLRCCCGGGGFFVLVCFFSSPPAAARAAPAVGSGAGTAAGAEASFVFLFLRRPSSFRFRLRSAALPLPRLGPDRRGLLGPARLWAEPQEGLRARLAAPQLARGGRRCGRRGRGSEPRASPGAPGEGLEGRPGSRVRRSGSREGGA